MKTISVFELEKYLISPDKWDKNLHYLPEKARNIILEERKHPSGPIGLGWHIDAGYFILASGQGPFLVWCEREIHTNEKTNNITINC